MAPASFRWYATPAQSQIWEFLDNWETFPQVTTYTCRKLKASRSGQQSNSNTTQPSRFDSLMIPSWDHDTKNTPSVTPHPPFVYKQKSWANKWWRVPETIFSDYPPKPISTLSHLRPSIRSPIESSHCSQNVETISPHEQLRTRAWTTPSVSI